MPTTTTTYSFNKPVVGADEDDWGGYLNGNWDSVDDLLDGTTPVTGIDINSGTLDGVTIGGTTAGAGTFTTLTANTSITGTLATAAQPNITSVGSLTSLDVGGTVTADGLTVDGNATINDNFPYILLNESDTTDLNTRISVGSGYFNLNTLDDAYTVSKQRFRLDNSTGDISFYEDTGTTAKFFWDASAESLGIGTSSPSETLDVSGNIRALGANSRVMFGPDGFEAGIKYATDASLQIASRTGESITFTNGHDGAERMRIDGSGNVLVGTTNSAPVTSGNVNGISLQATGGNLQVNRDSGIAAYFGRKTNDGSIVEFRKDGTTVGSIDTSFGNLLIRTAGNKSGIRFDTNNITPFKNGSEANGTVDLGYSNGRFKDLYLSGGLRGDTTFKNNAGTTEYARFDSSGNLLVGKTTTAFSTDGTHINNGGFIEVTNDGGELLYLNRKTSDGDAIRLFKDGVQVGSFGSNSSRLRIMSADQQAYFFLGNGAANSLNKLWLNGALLPWDNASYDIGTSTTKFKDGHFSGTVNAANFNTTSDATLKTNVEALTGSLDAVKAMRGVSFDWIENGNSEVGVIAQEVEAIVPDVVSTNDQGIKSVKYGNLVGVLIEAIKEQQAQIDELKAKLGD